MSFVVDTNVLLRAVWNRYTLNTASRCRLSIDYSPKTHPFTLRFRTLLNFGNVATRPIQNNGL